MAITASITDSVRVAGLALSESVALAADAAIVHEVDLPAAQAASGWILDTAGLTGTLTMGTGHTLSTSDVVDLYWKETINKKPVQKGRRGVVLGTVSVDQVPVTNSGAGDALPTEVTGLVITVGARTTLDVDLDGDKVCLAAYTAPGAEGAVSFTEVDLVEDFGRTVCPGCIWKWYLGNSEVNPLAGLTLTNAIVSQGSTKATKGQLAVQYQNA